MKMPRDSRAAPHAKPQRRPKEPKQTRWELTAAERDRFFTLSLDMLCIAGADGYFKWLNPAFTQTLGWTIDELLARPYADFVHPDDLAATLCEVQKQVKAGEKVLHFENRYRHKDGSWRVLSWKSTPQGELMYAAARDVTERNRLEQALHDANAELEARVSARTTELRGEIAERRQAQDSLREREARMRNLFDSNPLPMWTYDRESLRFVEVNDTAVAKYGYSRDEFRKMRITDIRPPEDVQRLLEILPTLPEGYRNAGEWRHRLKDGSIIDVEIASHDIEQSGKRVTLVMAQDITERKRLEDQLRQAQKMEAIGQLTGGIAHDFNNLLGIIVGNLDGVLETVDKESAPGKAVARALNGALHGAELTHRLLAFARRQPLDPKAFALNSLLPDVTAILQRTLGDAISVQVISGNDLWPVYADPSQVQDALVNLAINARDAMPDGGVLTIETANVHLDEHYALHNPEVKAGDYAMLAVSDTGSGMTAEVARRALEPFFTTKPAGQGTGLGLSMIYGFARQSGGHMKIYSEVGHGTSVKLYLPRARGDLATAGAQPQERLELPRGNETILVAEDNEDLRHMVAEQLSNLGYRIIEAKNGESALDILKGSEPIDLLFTDVVMSGQVTGHDLIREAGNRRPGLPVLLTTGYAEKTIAGGNGNAHFLRKPYRKRDLALKIRGILDLC
jgi:PAS domain S-box-containing protein